MLSHPQSDNASCRDHAERRNFGLYRWAMAYTLETRFLANPTRSSNQSQDQHRHCRRRCRELASHHRYEDFDFDDELRVMLEERTSFSPDAMTGMEANLRFAGPETMEPRFSVA